MRGNVASCSYEENTSRISELIAEIQAGRRESAEAVRQLLRPGAEFLAADRLRRSPAVAVATEVLRAAVGEILAGRVNTAVDLTRFTAHQIRKRTEMIPRASTDGLTWRALTSTGRTKTTGSGEGIAAART